LNLLQKFQQYIKANHLFTEKDKLLIAVSGGMDSVVLCELCKQSEYDFEIAHCNFQLRGEESKRDEAFVKELGEKYAVKSHVKIFDTAAIAKEQKKGIEETARDLRYGWFREILTKEGGRTTKDGGRTTNDEGRMTKDEGRKTNDQRPMTTDGRPTTDDLQPTTNNQQLLLTAHHADDNIETVMMNFFRGTGIRGLRGILPKQGNIIRPLLFATRKEIEAFAQQNNLVFVTDSTNAQSDYTRNYFRNELIPSIEKVFPETKQNILQSIKRFADVEQIYNESVEAAKKDLLEKRGNEIHIPVLKLAKMKPLQTIIFEIIKDYGFTAAQVPEAEKLLNSDSGKYILSATHRILRNRNWLIISSLQEPDVNYYLIEDFEKQQAVLFPGGGITAEKTAEKTITADPNIALVDADKLKFPLLLRRWKQGDYFYPLGMQKKKKLSRFFGDQKLSLLQKENVWIIESDKKIIWIAGMRIDDRFKITNTSKHVLKLTYRESRGV
jgi:tRNA(Ile)-lysidine synthase